MKLYRIILLFLLFLAAPILHAQQTDAQRWNEKISKGIEFKDSGKHDSAVFYLKAALEIAQRTFAKTDEKVIYNTHHLGEVYLEIEEFELAQEAIILTLNATESSKGKQHADYRFCLSRLALSYELMKDYSSALKLYKESLQNTKNNKGTNHQDYREELTNLANYYTRRRDLNNAVKVYLDLLENIELHLGREHVSYGSNQYQLGHLYYRMEDYDMALSAYSEDLEGVEKRLGKTNSTYIDRLWMLAGLHEKRKEYKIAADLYLEQLELTEEVFGKNKSYMYDIGSVAKLYESLGEYEKALPLYLDALEVTGKILGTDHFRYGDCLNNIAVLYERLGENTKALRLHTEALNVTESVLGKEHERYGTSLNNIGLLYSQAGDNEKALPLFLEALRIEQKVFGKSRSDYGVCVSNLANLYRSTGDYTKALPFFYEALENFENTLGKEHFRYGQTLNALALSYQSFGDYTKAAKLYSEALKNTEQSVGKNHETFGHVLINQAGMYEIIAEYERAQNNHLEANRNLLYQIRQIFKFRSEEEQKAFLKTALFRFDAAQSFGYNLENHFSSITEMNLNNQLLLKGLLLNSSKNVFEELRGLNDKETHKKLTTYRNQKTLLAKQYSLPVSKRTIDTDSLAELCNYQEAELVRLYQNEFKDNTSLSRDWKEIWAQLKPDELAIEFSHFDYRNNKEWTDSTLYVAYLIKKEWTAPKTVYLFEQQQLKSVLSHKTPNQLYATRGASVEDNGAAVLFADSIYNLVWKKLEPELGGVKTIYYATDGLLHQIPFAALGNQDSKSLSEQYNMVQLSSTAKLIDGKTKAKTDEILLIGGIDYTYDTTLSNTKQEVVYSYLNHEKLKRSRGESWNYLPGTKSEIEQIEANAAKQQKSASTLSGKLANEKAFKSLSGQSPSVLHIATHGFFFENAEKNKPKPENTQMQFTAADDPLLRSGLILAGGNYTWKHGSNPYENEDGILTALEISNLDLTNTELVVLSACETGLGDVEGNEGVYGLQRAFKMAGVESLIMSLWQVPDAETAEFMQLFYNAWFTGVSIREAFNATQRTMQIRYAEEPFKWAAFVLLD